MTSKNLFFKRFKQDIAQRVWLPVIIFLAGFLLLDLGLISRFNLWQERDDFVERALWYLQNTFFSSDGGFTIITIGAAVLCAVSGFVYMHSARKLDVYHSIPIKRESLFLQQYAYGMIYYLVPMAIHTVLCLLLCLANGVFTLGVVGMALQYLFTQLLIFASCYSVTVLAVCLTGNLVVGVLGSVVLLVYSLVLFLLQGSLMSTFFMTYSSHSMNAEIGGWALSPVHLLYKMLAEAGSVDDFNYGGYYLKFILMTLVYGGVALFLYKKRPTEAAGQSIAFAQAEPIIKTMVVFPGSIVAGYFFSAVLATVDDTGWFVFGCIFGFVILCPLMEIIFRKDMKAIFAHPLQLAFNGVCVVLTVVIFQFDVFGYDSYVPDESKVESYAVDFQHLSYIDTMYGDDYVRRLETMEIVDNESTRKLLEHAAELSRPARKGELDDLSEAGELYYTYLEVRYNLKGGDSVYRSYLINLKDEQVRQWMADTFNDVQHKLGIYPVLTDDPGKEYIGVNLTYPFDYEQYPLSGTQMEEFLEVYRRDLLNMKFEELWNEFPVARLSFAVQKTDNADEKIVMAEETAEYYNYDSEYLETFQEESGYVIYPSFTGTLALLEKYGAKVANDLPAECVVSLSVEDCADEVYDNNGYYDKIYAAVYLPESGQTEEIEQILEAVIPNGFIGYFNEDSKVEPYIDVRVHYILNEIEMTQNCQVKKGMLPAFVREDLKEAAAE